MCSFLKLRYKLISYNKPTNFKMLRKLLFLIVLINISICKQDETKAKMKFLQKRFASELFKLSSNKTEGNLNVTFKYEDRKLLQVPTNFSRIRLFQNSQFILLNGTVCSLDTNNISNIVSANCSVLPNVEFQKIKFVESIIYDGHLIIYVSRFNLPSLIFKYKNIVNKWILIQYTDNQGFDAKFFTNERNLYLVVATDKFLKIYQWTNSFFNEIQKIDSVSILRLLVFKEEHYEFMAIIEKSFNNEWYQLSIFSFETVYFRRIQILDVTKHSQIIFYKLENQIYLAILDETVNSFLYVLNGVQFELANILGTFSGTTNISVEYIENYPILFLLKKEELCVIIPTSKDLNVTNCQNLNDENTVNTFEFKIVNLTNHRALILNSNLNGDNILTCIPLEITFTPRDKKQDFQKAFSFLDTSFQEKHKKIDLIMKTLENYLVIKSEDTVGQFQTAFLFPSQFFILKVKHTIFEINIKLANIKTAIPFLKQNIDSLYHKNDRFTGFLNIQGKLVGNLLETQNLNVKYLNGVPWNRDAWLSYSRNQTIEHPFVVKHVVSNRVILPNNINDDKQATLILTSIKAHNIYTTNINNVSLKNVYRKSEPSIIKGIKTFKTLSVDNLESENITIVYEERSTEILNKTVLNNRNKAVNITSGIGIKNLLVDSIDGVGWRAFRKSVFCRGTSGLLKGTLTSDTFSVDYFETNKILDIDTSHILTTSTPQNIAGNFTVSTIHANNLKCGKINNLVFEKEVATQNNSNIKGPVHMSSLTILGTLYEPRNHSFLDNLLKMNKDSFSQIYSEVNIRGNLYVSNLTLLHNIKWIINGKHINQLDLNNYWLKSGYQVISNYFVAQNGIDAFHLICTKLNDHDVNSYSKIYFNGTLTGNLYFKNAYVSGNIILNKGVINTPNFEEIERESVKTTGSFNLTGSKSINGVVRINTLHTNYLDGKKVSDALTISKLTSMRGTITFQDLMIQDNLISSNYSTNYINDIKLSSLEDSVLYINKPGFIDTLVVKTVEAQDIEASNLNDVNVYNYLDKIYNIGDLKVLNHLIINGNCRIEEIRDVVEINTFQINSLLSKIKSNNTLKTSLYLDDLNVKSLDVEFINNIHIDTFMSNLLRKHTNQIISAVYSFDKIETPNIMVPRINEVNTHNIIDINMTYPQILEAAGGLCIKSLSFFESLSFTESVCNLTKAYETLTNPPSTRWQAIYVSQNVSLGNDCSLRRLLQYSLSSTANNTLNYSLIFEHNVVVKTVRMDDLINGYNFSEIMMDAVSKYGDQLIKGYKNFTKLIVTSALVERDANVSSINMLSPSDINDRLVFTDLEDKGLITGKKTFFTGLTTNTLLTSTISGINISDLVSLKSSRIIPSAFFTNLNVSDWFHMEHINNINVPYFLNNRLLRHSYEEQVLTGTFYFGRIELYDELYVEKINGLMLEDMIFDYDKQNISGAKHFANQTTVERNIIVETINGRNMTRVYEESLNNYEDIRYSGNMKFNEIAILEDEVTAQSLNGITLNSILEMMNQNLLKLSFKDNEEANTFSHNIKSFLDNIFDTSQSVSNAFLYVDSETQISKLIRLSSIWSATISELEDRVIMNINQKQSSSLCGVQENCLCFTNEVVEINKNLSISNAPAGTSNQVVFRYEDNEVLIQVFGVSYTESASCYTKVNHITITYSEKHGESYYHKHHIPGSLKHTQFIKIGSNVYTFINRVEEHGWSDIFIHTFNSQKDVGETQIIEKERVLMHLFKATQGTFMIIKFTDTFNKTCAEIYEFRETSLKFEPIQTIDFSADIYAVTASIQENTLFFAIDRNLMVYQYSPESKIYHYIKELPVDLRINSLSTFCLDGENDEYLIITSIISTYQLYSLERKEYITSGKIKGLQKMVPFVLNNKHYILAASFKHSSILVIVQQGYN